jgi:hypothetical protein
MTDVQELRGGVGTALTRPVEVDWSERIGADMDGWTAYEAFMCETEGCGLVTVAVGAFGEVSCGESGDTFTYTGDGETVASWGDDHDEKAPEPCGEYVGHAEGPMMNYAYPLPEDIDGPDAAYKLRDLPLVPVEMDGSWYLALTGGGMDLSWEICAAYVTLGFLPPMHFAGNLPRIGTMGTEHASWFADVIAAAQFSLDIAARYMENERQRFTEWREREALKRGRRH